MMPNVLEVQHAHRILPPPERELLDEALEWVDLAAKECFSGLSFAAVEETIQDVVSLFQGRFPGYRRCDTRYHDLEHTLRLIPPFCQAAVALAKNHPGVIHARDFELGLIAVLLHDSGYIREKNDRSGTGGKHTFCHIDRSVAFARNYLSTIGYRGRDLLCVEQMIRCTGVKPELEQVSFSSDACRLLGYALGTADLIAQMADPSYVDKLPLLFSEFQEAYEYEGPEKLKVLGIRPFESARELIRNTPLFFKEVVCRRLKAMDGVYYLLEDPETGQNPYLVRISENLQQIDPRSYR